MRLRRTAALCHELSTGLVTLGFAAVVLGFLGRAGSATGAWRPSSERRGSHICRRRLQVVRRRSPSPTSASRLVRASQRCSGRTAPASRRCCACCAGSPSRPGARYASWAGSARGPGVALHRPHAAAGERLRTAHGARVRHPDGEASRAPTPDAEAARVLALVELDPDDPRKLTAYSKGMRQRVKVAQAIVHDPEVLLLDEPLTGLDPRQRGHMVEAVPEPRGRRPMRDRLEPRARGGRAARLARARHVAGPAGCAGDFHELRALMDDRPLRVRVRTDRPRELAAALVQSASPSA